MLYEGGYDMALLGRRKGELFDRQILAIKDKPEISDIHTITLYVNPAFQKDYQDYLIGLKPRRIIFNPGTENPHFMQQAVDNGIEVEEACTLVLLSMGQF